MKRILFIVKHLFKKLLIKNFFNRYVINDILLQQDIEQTIKVRGCKVNPNTLKKKFEHLMIYYPDFAFIFFWRIKRQNYLWKKLFTYNAPCKIFRSTKIKGGMMCYHPFATVINAKSIGHNFQFRNGLTIGNKYNDNALIPSIGNDVTVGANVVIIGDITIGNNVVIGAGTVVVKDVSSNSIIAGNPARVIRKLSHE
jgi:serine O-acetyltransferase